MKLAQIRQRMAYDPLAKQTQKEAARLWVEGKHTSYSIALTLTLKQSLEIRTVRGCYFKNLDREECGLIAKRFTQKLNQQVFGSRAAKKYGKSLAYFITVEGVRSKKNLHLHLSIGNLPAHVALNEIEHLILRAKERIDWIDEQYEMKVKDSGWIGYTCKELGKRDTDNALWDLM